MGWLLVTPMILLFGAGSTASVATTVNVTGTILPLAGFRTLGLAVMLVNVGGVLSGTVTEKLNWNTVPKLAAPPRRVTPYSAPSAARRRLPEGLRPLDPANNNTIL